MPERAGRLSRRTGGHGSVPEWPGGLCRRTGGGSGKHQKGEDYEKNENSGGGRYFGSGAVPERVRRIEQYELGRILL